jgi:hypothetical protein
VGHFSHSHVLTWNLLQHGSLYLDHHRWLPMRVISVAAAFSLLASASFAQTPGSNPPPPSAVPGGAPEVGSPLLPSTDAGLNKVASDGVSMQTVRAVPCKRAARCTDGTNLSVHRCRSLTLVGAMRLRPVHALSVEGALPFRNPRSRTLT